MHPWNRTERKDTARPAPEVSCVERMWNVTTSHRISRRSGSLIA